MNKKVLIKLSVIGIVLVMVVGSAVAYFGNQENNLGKTFASGNLALKIDNTCSYNGSACPEIEGITTSWTQTDLGPAHKFFYFENVKPGDYGKDSISLHLLDDDAWVNLAIINIVDSDNTCNEPELDAEGTCLPAGSGELRENLDFWVWLDQGQTPGFQGKGDLGEGDNLENYSEPTLIAKGAIDAAGEDWNLADGLSAVYTSFSCSSATLPICQGINEDGLMNKDLTYYFGIGWELPLSVGNEAQDDIFGADMVFYAESIEPEMTTIILENKRVNGDWSSIEGDGIYGELSYNEEGPTFDYIFNGYGLNANTSYSLIYYADGYPGNHPGAFLGKTTTDGFGNMSLSDNINLGMDLPDPADTNYPTGAKIWLVPSSGYSEATKSIIGWSPTTYLLETGRVNYQYIDIVVQKTINLADLGASSQYGYYHDYSGANVSFVYDTPVTGKLSGTITATGLKPYATYQIKFEGKPICADVSGDDLANEYIGYKGRWWNNTTNSNTNDAGYLVNSIYHGGTQCIVGYLVWDFMTADATGAVTKTVETTNSYHVLWSGGGVCHTNTNTYLANLDLAHPTIWFSPADKVNGELERHTCNGLVLDSGSYDLNMILNEESFHQGPGTWTAVMASNIEFDINP